MIWHSPKTTAKKDARKTTNLMRRRRQKTQFRACEIGIKRKNPFACLGIMIVGFVLALIDNRITALIGYPLAFIGAAASMVNTQWDTTNHKITKIVLCVFCMLCAMQFVLLIMGNG